MRTVFFAVENMHTEKKSDWCVTSLVYAEVCLLYGDCIPEFAYGLRIFVA